MLVQILGLLMQRHILHQSRPDGHHPGRHRRLRRRLPEHEVGQVLTWRERAERSARRWRLARALLTRDHAEKTKISFELTCAAVGALGRALLGALGLMPITTYEKQAVVGADARGGVPVPLARPRGAQVAHGTRRTDRSDRAAVEAELPM